MIIDLKRPKKIVVMITIVCVIAALFLLGRTVGRKIFPMEYSTLVEEYSAEFGLDPQLVYAIIHTESGFDPAARSPVGACGLMQIMPETFDWLQTKLPPGEIYGMPYLTHDYLDIPEVNIRYGTLFLSILLREFADERLAVAAYHAGQGRVRQWLSSGQVTPGSFEIGDIPSSATSHYVSKVERAKGIYALLYG